MGKILSIFAVIALALTGLLTGCNNAGCVDMRSSTPRADFYSDSSMRAITIDSIEVTGIGAPGDSLLYTEGQRLSKIYLPMPADANAVSWRIAYREALLAERGIADTLSYAFERYPWFAGEECGAMFRYRITSMNYTTHIIDSVAIVDSLVVNIDRPTFNIYFRTN